jgi:hypothetical protein
MANPNGTKKNLKVPSSKEARLLGRKGGNASVAAQRKKKALHLVLTEFLDVRLGEISDKGIRDLLITASGSKDKNKTVRELIVDGLILSSISGNSAMMRILLELSGDDPILKIRREELALKKKAVKAAEKQGVETFSAMQQLVDSLRIAQD